MRKRWKWLAPIAFVIAIVLWPNSGNAPTTTTLHLRQFGPLITYKDQLPARRFPRETDGIEDHLRFASPFSVRFELQFDRIIRVVSTNYSIEARTPAGRTNYDAPFLGDFSPFQTLGTRIFSGAAYPVEVAVPIDADEFRVKMELEEYSAFYSEFQTWAFNGPTRNRFDLALRQWLLGAQLKGTPTTVWSPWVVRSNTMWVEKVAR